MSSNNPNLNPKQQELVDRLERIRQRRSASENEADLVNEDRQVQQPSPKRSNRNKQTHTSARPRNRNEAPKKRNQAAPRNRESQRKQRSHESIESVRQYSKSGLATYTAPRTTTRSTNKKQSTRKKQQKVGENNLIKQLSDGNKLADAMILSEILSKPVALRKK